jgi:anti-sigma B factor antagonist
MSQRATLEAAAHASDGQTVIELRGDIDGAGREALGAAYDAAPAGTPLLLDFARVDYINSTGIALIVGLLARARAEARPISARGLSPHYREIFEITRLSDFITILADEPSPRNDEHGVAA